MGLIKNSNMFGIHQLNQWAETFTLLFTPFWFYLLSGHRLFHFVLPSALWIHLRFHHHSQQSCLCICHNFYTCFLSAEAWPHTNKQESALVKAHSHIHAYPLNYMIKIKSPCEQAKSFTCSAVNVIAALMFTLACPSLGVIWQWRAKTSPLVGVTNVRMQFSYSRPPLCCFDRVFVLTQ